jgi:hypothetical protein
MARTFLVVCEHRCSRIMYVTAHRWMRVANARAENAWTWETPEHGKRLDVGNA